MWDCISPPVARNSSLLPPGVKPAAGTKPLPLKAAAEAMRGVLGVENGQLWGVYDRREEGWTGVEADGETCEGPFKPVPDFRVRIQILVYKKEGSKEQWREGLCEAGCSEFGIKC